MKQYMKLVIAVVLACILCGVALAEEAVPEFEYYIQDDGKVTITYYAGISSEVTVPETLDGYPVVGIGKAAFAYNESLRKVVLPDCIQKIGDGAFRGCTMLEIVQLPKQINEATFFEMFKDCESLITVQIPDGVKMLAKEAFGGCSSLEEIILPESVTNYGPGVFRGCQNLKNITIPGSISMYASSAFEDSPLTPYMDEIKSCMVTDMPFVMKDGKH